MYVYVASSWRNPLQPTVVDALRAAGIDCYDFRNPAEGEHGFSWRAVGGRPLTEKGRDFEPVDNFLRMIEHPTAIHGFGLDFAAMERADAFVMVLPCGKSTHLELGYAAGAKKRAAVLLEDPVEPELMYRMVDLLTPSVDEIIAWLS